MTKLDPLVDSERGWQSMNKFIAMQTNPKHKALMEMVQEHMRTEVRGDHAGLMATLVDQPQYHMWGGPADTGPKGRQDVSDFYQAMFDNNGQGFEFEIRRVIVDDNGVVTEGVLRTSVPGSGLRSSRASPSIPKELMSMKASCSLYGPQARTVSWLAKTFTSAHRAWAT
jgi:hypothetical protein